MALYSSSRPEGNHTNLTNTFHLQTEVFLGVGMGGGTLQNSIQIRTTQNWRVQARTITQTATASSHTHHYDVIWMC